MFCHLSWVKGATARLLSRRNGLAGQLAVVGKVKVKAMNSLVMPLVFGLRRCNGAGTLRED